MGIQSSYQIPLAKYPAVRIAILLAGGIILGVYTSVGLWFWVIIFGGSFIVWAIVEFMIRIRLKIGLSHAAIICYCLGIFCFGGLWQTLFSLPQGFVAWMVY